MTEITELTLEFKQQLVETRDPETGQSLKFIVKEFNGKGRDAYINIVAKMTKQVNGSTEVQNFDGLQAELISRCMFSFDGNQIGEAVTKNWVQGLPAHIVTQLFEMCQALCGLGEGAENEAKND
jgi:hypothetical protein